MVNKVKNILEIEYPVIQGGMDAISNSELVAAVSESGGLGVLQTGTLGEDGLRKEIEKTQELTSRSFGVNFPIFRKGEKTSKMMDVALDMGVEVFAVSAGNPKPFLDKIQKARASMQVIPSVMLAKRMENFGFDMVVAEGGEAGGATSAKWDSTLSLVPNVVEEVDIPVIAAGGIADEITVRAAKALGAGGVQMGTRFLASEECSIPNNLKQLIVKSTSDDIVGLRSGGVVMNVIENDRVEGMFKKGMVESVYSREWFKKAEKEGDIEEGILRAGQSVGRINNVKPVKEIVEQIGKAFLSA